MLDDSLYLEMRCDELADAASRALLDSNYDYCIALWKIMRRRFPGHEPAWSGPVYAALRAGNHALAEELASEALELAPEYLDSWAGWAQIATYMKEWPEAVRRWEEVSRRFPASSLGYARLAQAFLELDMPGKAISQSIRSLGIQKSEQTALMVLADALLREEKYEEAKSVAASALRYWPDNYIFYLLAIRAAIQLNNLEEAEKICHAGIRELPDSVSLYVEQARLGEIAGNEEQEKERWYLVRRRFPEHEAGYMGGFDAALRRNDWLEAAEIAMLTQKKCPAALATMSMPEKYGEDMLAWAKKPLENNHTMESLRRLGLYTLFYPADVTGYLETALLYVEQQRFHKTELVCRTALEKTGFSREITEQLVLACAMQNKGGEAWDIAFSSCVAHPDDTELLVNLIYILLGHNLCQEAKSLYARFGHLILPGPGKARLNFALRLQAEPEKALEFMADCVEEQRRFAQLKLPLSLSDRIYLNMMARLTKYKPVFAKRHKALTEALLIPLQSETDEKEFPKKLCYYGELDVLTYLSAVIKYIPPSEIDLLITDKRINKKLLQDRGLADYNIVNPAQIGSYHYILGDTLGKVPLVQGQQLICFPHAVDNVGTSTLAKAGALILPFEAAMLNEALRLKQGETECLASIPCERKCEIAFSGPYHIERPALDKIALKEKIGELYNINIDPERPLAYVVDGENVHFAHMIYAINKMAEYATVIYKPCYSIPDHLRNNINPAITVLIDGFANNVLRFGADIMLADYYSGTCMSSMLLGLPIIPYYSTTIKHKNPRNAAKKPIHYLKYTSWYGDGHYRKYITPNPKAAMMAQLTKHGLLYHILDSEGIRSTIISGEVNKRFTEHFDDIQMAAFGEYKRNESSKITADMIIHYAKKGTFGKDCAAVLLKS